MYFKINPPQKDKYTDMGMVNISASFFLEEGDEGYDKYMAEHHVQVPVFPEKGYPRQKEYEEVETIIINYKDKDNFSVEFKSSEKEIQLHKDWVASLPTEERDNPFCNHSIQFEHDVTTEEILWCFEYALAITARNYLIDDLHCQNGGQVVNQNIHYLSRKAFYEGVKQIPKTNQNIYEKTELAKVENAEAKVETLTNIDFTSVKTIAKYSVKS